MNNSRQTPAQYRCNVHRSVSVLRCVGISASALGRTFPEQSLHNCWRRHTVQSSSVGSVRTDQSQRDIAAALSSRCGPKGVLLQRPLAPTTDTIPSLSRHYSITSSHSAQFTAPSLLARHLNGRPRAGFLQRAAAHCHNPPAGRTGVNWPLLVPGAPNPPPPPTADHQPPAPRSCNSRG